MVFFKEGSRERSASEPSGNLAPRLDRQGQQFPWVRIHFITSSRPGKRRVRDNEHVVACSRAVSGGLRRRVRRAGIAVAAVRWRRGAGVGSRRAGVIGPARMGAAVAVSRTGVIGNDGGSVPRPRQKRRRRRARVSAQRAGRGIFLPADVRSAGLLCHVLAERVFVEPAFLQRGLPAGVTARAGSRGPLSTTSAALATGATAAACRPARTPREACLCRLESSSPTA